MNPHISLPRQHSSTFGGIAPSSSRSDAVRMPRFFKRLFKFPQMDFELAIWEMTSLMIAPKKVFRSIYYHKQTKNTWHRPDPSFTYLLALFLLLTALAWGVAYADGVLPTLRITLVFIFGHFLLASLAVSTLAYVLVGRLLGPGSGEEALEFGYCFDVSIRAFLPVWVVLYVVQFLLMPVVAKDYWISHFFGNLLYFVAAMYYTAITFLGYNALPFLQHTELLLAPVPILSILFVISLFGFNAAKHLAPVLWCGATLRKHV
ncbi:UNC-50 family protein [Microthyrium microscopicum]|uniref:UNC-50 family protein n=1 Tax=Microthyrium microscopicum TaxID=703497 RepID=A0A6A6U4D4_9PEZI|nr:UNC-50 family protein [Microthyrium microscopicum]